MHLISKYKLLNILYLFAISIGITFLVMTFLSAIGSLTHLHPFSFDGFLSGFQERYFFLYDYFYSLTAIWFVILLIIYLFKSRGTRQQ
ncbi:MAG TPA: hypothetical protein PLR06_12995 [Cyclobacteriaceae bacterium]|nr:hypothetical protein [Cyclobacteriaceae bacterium]